MKRHRRALCGTMALALVVLVPTGVWARAVESWPYDRLLREADLVVIAQPMASADTAERTRLGGWTVNFIGVNTDLKVRAVLKGTLKGDRLRVLHFRQPKDVRIDNGPGLVAFRQKGMEIRTNKGRIETSKPSYLLFLTRRKDGRFEPVSGRVDPVMSVRVMYRPLPAGLEK